ncbi:MAG: hypothetical protein JNM66_15345 [Bryobacterales bacterium]|nr:hypothetical protein [Bryobacterales bacterium]
MCPFPDDREPSLVITPAKNHLRCLGACQTGDDVTAWTMRLRCCRRSRRRRIHPLTIRGCSRRWRLINPRRCRFGRRRQFTGRSGEFFRRNRLVRFDGGLPTGR